MIQQSLILKSQVEGDLKIKQVQLLTQDNTQLFIQYLLNIITLGIFSLSVSFKKKLCFSAQRYIETSTHVLVETTDSKFYFEKLESQFKDGAPQKYFQNRKMKYFYDQRENSFQALQLDIEGKKISEIAQSQPQEEQKIEQQIQLYGDSFIDIEVPSYLKYMSSQILQPINYIFYFGQAVNIAQLYYTFFSIAIVAQILILSIIYYYVRIAKKQLRDACHHDIQIQVLRSSEIQSVSSMKLVPGDIIIINKNITLPFDCILLEGQLQVNEANLTGETIPVVKSPLPKNSDLLFKQIQFTQKYENTKNIVHRYENQKSQILLEGTSIIKMEMNSAKALVVRTGLSSFKGQIIRALLFPQPFDKRFLIQGAKFCGLMILFCSIAFFSVLYQYKKIKLSSFQIALRYLDMLQFCVPTAIPIIINIMVFFGLMRLLSEQIMGSDPMKQIQSGRVQTICFDKTGTLTENFVEIIGYCLPQQENLQIVGQNNNDEIIDKILGICHQASTSEDDQNNLVGDPIDIQMIKFGGWEIGHDQDRKKFYAKKNDNKLYSILVNEFHSEFQSMSVVTQDIQNNRYYLFVKGSPEVIISRCQDLAQQQFYLKRLHQLAVQGYRILGLGYREIPLEEIENFQTLQRQEQEKNILFSGFLIFKNNLKKDTKKVVGELKEAGLSIKIISGDNPVTTIKIAEECSILRDTNSIILLDRPQLNSQFISIYQIDEEGHKNEIQFEGVDQQLLKSQITFCQNSIKQNKHFCLTGNAQSFFQERTQTLHEDALGVNQNQQNKQIESFYKLLLLHTQIFARTSPEQKALVVKNIKSLGQTVCMVGDGANDCSAIKEADIGVSFSDTDGQFSAPYISKQTSIGKIFHSNFFLNINFLVKKQIECVKQILLEGRAVLQTSREIFKGYITVGILRFMAYMALSYFYSGLGDFQMTWQGYVCGYTLNFVFYGLSKPVKKLEKIIIDDDFFGIHTLISTIFSLMMFSSQFAVILTILQNSPNYKPTTQLQSDGLLSIEGQENTLLFIAVLVDYLYVYLSNYKSSPIKIPIYKNYIFFISMVLQALYSNIIIFTDVINVKSLKLRPIYDNEAEIKIFFTLHGFGIIVYLFDYIFTKKLFSKVYQQKQLKKQQQITFDLNQKLIE